MNQKNANIMKVDFKIDQGLILRWNLLGNLNVCYFRHIVLLDVEGEFEIKKFITAYVQNIKIGDMMTYAYVNSRDQYILGRWKEKTPLMDIEVKKLAPCISKPQNVMEILEIIHQKTSDFLQPTYVSIVSQRNPKQILLLKKDIQKLIQKRRSWCINIFADLETSIEVTSGINFYNLNESKTEQFWNSLKIYQNKVIFLNTKLTIQCENGCLSSQKQTQWKNVQFNKIIREARFPTVDYLQDIIHFVNKDGSEQIKYKLNISLQFQYLDQKQFISEKSVTIKAMTYNTYHRTVGQNQVQYSTEVAPGLFSRKNPFQSQSLVWFLKNFQN